MRQGLWLIVVGLTLTLGAGAWSAAGKTAPRTSEQGETAQTCANMMQGAGASEEGKKAMRDFMQSDRAPQAMANMMEMARRMGNGDVMLGMTRMMEMMGGQGGMMSSGQGMP